MVSTLGQGERFDWEDELDQPWGHPILAIVLGVAAIGIIGAILCASLSVDISSHAGAALLIALVVAAIAWAIAWFVDLRRTTIGWGIGAAGAYALTALLVVGLALAAATVATSMDIQAMQRIRISAEGKPELPPGERAGPITRRGMAFLGDMLAERHKREALMIAGLGIDRLTDASALVRAPQLLTDCDRFARAKPEIDASDRRIATAAATFRRDLAAAIRDPSLRQQAVTGFDKGFGGSVVKLQAASTLIKTQLDRAVPLCHLLARHNWRDQGPMFMFTSRGDMEAFDRLITPWNDLVRKQQEMRAQSDSDMRASGLVDGRSRL